MPSTSPRIAALSPELLAQSARYAARAVARERLRRVIRLSPVAELQDGEDALHDFRVALRRLRTWLAAFTPELEDTVGRGTLRRLRRVSRRAGLARDVEVQLGWLAQPTVPLPALATAAAADLATQIRAEQSSVRDQVLEAIVTELPRAGRKLDRQLRRYEVRVWLDPERDDPPMAAAMGRLLHEGAERLRAALDQVASPNHSAEAHQARLAVKHLRYLLESLDGQRRGVRRAAFALATLQDALGLLHDRHVLLARVADEISVHGPRRPLTTLRHALERDAARAHRRARRVAGGRAFGAALAAVDRIAKALLGATPAPWDLGTTDTDQPLPMIPAET